MVSLVNTNVDPEVGNWGGSVTQREAGIEWLQAELVRGSKVEGQRRGPPPGGRQRLREVSQAPGGEGGGGWEGLRKGGAGEAPPPNHPATHPPTPILRLIESSFRTGGTSLKPKTSSARYKKGGKKKKSHLFGTPSAREPKGLYLFYRNHRAVERVSPEKMGPPRISSPSSSSSFLSNL